MKKVKIILSLMVFTLAITGVFFAKANESKLRTTASDLYYDDDGNSMTPPIHLLASPPAQFDNTGSGVQAAILDPSGAPYDLYEDASLSVPVYFTP